MARKIIWYEIGWKKSGELHIPDTLSYGSDPFTCVALTGLQE